MSETRGRVETGVADAAIVCYVELSGEFMPERVPYGVTVYPSSVGYLILDAHSGNFLISSPKEGIRKGTHATPSLDDKRQQPRRTRYHVVTMAR